MEEEVESQEPPATEEAEEEEDVEPIESIIIEDEDGPTTRKVQTEFTIPCKGAEAEAMAAAAKGPVKPRPPPFTPCGDMPLPPGADPGQWGFPEFCPRKMTRYAEAAAAAAAEAADPETAMPGEAADTILEEEREEPAEDALAATDGQESDAVNLSVLSEDAKLTALGEEGEVFMDAIGGEEHDEWYSDEDVAETAGGIKVDIKVEMPKGIADAGSVGFQAPAAADEDGGPQEEEEEGDDQQQPADEGALQPLMADGTEPVLWKIEQEIAVVRSKLSEMQEKITALDIADISGGTKPAGLPGQRKKCVCDPQKKAAERGLPAPAMPANPLPPTVPGGYHSAPVLQQYNQRNSFTNVAQDFRMFPQQFPQAGGGVDIYIASRSGNTSAVTSINPANFQQYAEKPVLKAFTSPDVDVYVVTDKGAQPGYPGQN